MGFRIREVIELQIIRQHYYSMCVCVCVCYVMSCQCNRSCQHWVEPYKRQSLYTECNNIFFSFLASKREEDVAEEENVNARRQTVCTGVETFCGCGLLELTTTTTRTTRTTAIAGV